MFVKNPKYRKRLSSSQERILAVCFKFKFVTVPFLAEWIGKDKSTIYEQLVVLVSRGYVLKTYEKEFRAERKAAIYILSVEGIGYLRAKSDDYFNKNGLKSMYKNRTASEPLVVQSLNAFKLCLELRRHYGAQLVFYSKSEMAASRMFLRPFPDVYIRQVNPKTGRARAHYFVEVVEPGEFTIVLLKRLWAHDEHYDDHKEDWEDSYPTLLFICSNTPTERRIHLLAQNEGYSDDGDDFGVMTTTTKLFYSGTTSIWWHYDYDWDKDDDLPERVPLP